MDDRVFHSPSDGEIDFKELIDIIIWYMKENRPYQIIIGADSVPKHPRGADFVVALVIHRIGAGARYFWQRIEREKLYILRERIYDEALLSLELATKLVEALKNYALVAADLEIHVDIGRTGPTRAMINEVVGMIRGNGFPNVKIKPEAYGAAIVADRHT